MIILRVLRGLGNLAALILIAGFVPLYKGFDFFDPLFLIPYASLPMVLAAGLAAKRPPSRRDAIAVILRAWLFGIFVVFAGIAVVNYFDWTGSVQKPLTVILIGTALFSLGAVAAVTTVVMWFRIGDLAAKFGVMALIVAAVWGMGKLPESIQAEMTSVNIAKAAIAGGVMMLLIAGGLFAVLDRNQAKPLGGDGRAGDTPVA